MVMHPDLAGSILEGVGAALAWTNFYRLYRDDDVKGVHWVNWHWYILCGLYDVLYVYPTLNQPFTILFSAARCSANVAWLLCAIKIKLRLKRGVTI